MTSRRITRLRRTAGALVVSAAVGVPAALAAWPQVGGDPGRSSFVQDVGVLPVREAWSKTEVPRTGPVIAGDVVAYGGAGGRVHLQRLSDGGPVGDEPGVLVDDGAQDPDVFTGEGTSGTAFAGAAFAAAATQLLVVHNDDGESGVAEDVQVALLDAGKAIKLRADHVVPASASFTVSSPALLAPADPDGTRQLIFLGFKPEQQQIPPLPSIPSETRLFRVPLLNAGGASASFGQGSSVPVASPNRAAAPVYAALRDGSGLVMPTVLIAGADGVVRGYRLGDLSQAPISSPDLGEATGAPAVPLGTSGTFVFPTLTFYVAAGQVDGTTIVRRLGHASGAGSFTVEDVSPPLTGLPGPGLALTQLGGAAGRIVITTGANLFTMGTELDDVQSLAASSLTPGVSGFSWAVPSAGSGLVFAMRDNGEHVVARLPDASAAGGGFTPAPGNASPSDAAGQPALAARRAVFASDRGVFAYSVRSADAAQYPAASVSGAGGSEGGEAVFTVTLSRPADEQSSVAFATSDDSALAGADYGARTGTLSFAAGQTSATVAVPLFTDGEAEPEERFTLTLSGGDGLNVAGATAAAAIADVAPVATPVATPVPTPPTVRSGGGTPAVDPDNFEIFVTPARDRRAPYVFTVRSVLDRPPGVSAARGCRGRVTITLSAGRKVFAKRRSSVRSTCRSSTRLVIPTSQGFPKSGVLVVRGTFEGNAALERVRAISLRVRTR